MKQSFFLLLPGLLLAQTQTTYRVSTVAGIPWSNVGPAVAPAVMLKTPFGIVFDKRGNLYVANYELHSVRRIEPDGRTTTVAGDGINATVVDPTNPAAARRLSFPRAIAIDGNRYLYISEPNNQRIRRLDLETNEIATIIGGRGPGFSPDGTVGTQARLNEVLGLAVDLQGDLIIAETGSHRIRRWTATTGVLSTVAGNGTAGFAGDAGPAVAARLNRPSAVVVHPSGDIYFYDFENRRVRRIQSGNIATIAGTPTGTMSQGPALQVNFQMSTGIALDPEGRNLYVTDERSHRIFKLQLSDATVSVVAGTGNAGRVTAEGVPAATAGLFTPTNIAVDALGGVVFADTNNHRIRRIGPDGTIRTVAGMNRGLQGAVTPDQALFDSPRSIRLDALGRMTVADTGNCQIRSVVSNLVTLLAGLQGSCALDSTINSAVMDRDRNVFWLSSRGLWYRPAAGTGPSAGTLRNNNPGLGLVLTNDGESVQYVEPSRGWVYSASRTAVLGTQPLMTFLTFGQAGPGFADGGQFAAKFFAPDGLVYNSTGDLFVNDTGNRAIRRIHRFEATTYARLPFHSAGVAIDSTDRVWVSTGPQIVALSPEGQITTVIGGTTSGLSPDKAAGQAIQIGHAHSLIGGRNGSLYFIDSTYNVIRQVTPVSLTGLELVDGDKQTGLPESKLKAPLRVRLVGSDGLPLSGMAIDFKTATAGIADLPPSVVTDANGIASAAFTLPKTLGALTVTASTGALSVPFTVTVAGPPAVVTTVSVAADYGGGARIAPGSWIEIRGTALAALAKDAGESDFKDGLAPVTLAGTSVTINGQALFLQSVSPTLIRGVAPEWIGENDIPVVVTTVEGASPAVTLAAAVHSPALLAPAALKVGDQQFVWARIEDGVLAAPADTPVEGFSVRAAKAGERLTFQGTGAGNLPPYVIGTLVAGEVAVPGLEVKLGDTVATVETAMLTPGTLGLFYFTITVPEGVIGTVPVTASLNGVPVTQVLWTVIE